MQPVLIAMCNFKLPIHYFLSGRALSSPKPIGSANPQRPLPSLASSGGAPRSGWMEAEGSWWFPKALETAKEGSLAIFELRLNG